MNTFEIEEPVLLSTEKVSIDQFMCDYFKEDETITVNANWLQKQLVELNQLFCENEKLKQDKQEVQRSLNLLKSKLDNLNLAMDIIKTKHPKVLKTKILDVKG